MKTETKITIAGLLGLFALSWLYVAKHSISYTHPTNDAQLSETTAMITNLAGNSGGTGVILRSFDNLSWILTNAHVCGVVKNGGIVSTANSRSLVTSYRLSLTHDLCAISVMRNLHTNTEVRDSAPDLYSASIIAGHPSLLPTVVTRGHFSEREFIQVMTGFRDCTKEDLEGPEAGMCFFFGGIPVIKRYEAQVSSATISPGSSGSAVFDASGYLSGLAFAGSGPLGYAHIVPQSNVSYFVNTEIRELSDNYPIENTDPDLNAAKMKNFRRLCKDARFILPPFAKSYCTISDNDVIYNNEQ